MERQEPLGIYTCFVPGVEEYAMYKYCIETYTGEYVFKADPYANYAELRPGTASKVVDITDMKWTDKAWMDRRTQWNHRGAGIHIRSTHRLMERHLGRRMRDSIITGICERDRQVCKRTWDIRMLN